MPSTAQTSTGPPVLLIRTKKLTSKSFMQRKQAFLLRLAASRDAGSVGHPRLIEPVCRDRVSVEHRCDVKDAGHAVSLVSNRVQVARPPEAVGQQVDDRPGQQPHANSMPYLEQVDRRICIRPGRVR